jgi:hypothetical protein
MLAAANIAAYAVFYFAGALALWSIARDIRALIGKVF